MHLCNSGRQPWSLTSPFTVSWEGCHESHYRNGAHGQLEGIKSLPHVTSSGGAAPSSQGTRGRLWRVPPWFNRHRTAAERGKPPQTTAPRGQVSTLEDSGDV